MAANLAPRWDDDYDDYYWWYSPTAVIVKWTIAAIIVAILCGYLCGGYIHAKRRLSRGLPPLAYHRWMVRRQMTPAAYNPQGYYTNGAPAGPAQQYGNYGAYAQQYPPPPPVYQQHAQPPPGYYANMQDIPLNATKAAPNQNLPSQQSGVTGEASGSGSRH